MSTTSQGQHSFLQKNATKHDGSNFLRTNIQFLSKRQESSSPQDYFFAFTTTKLLHDLLYIRTTGSPLATYCERHHVLFLERSSPTFKFTYQVFYFYDTTTAYLFALSFCFLRGLVSSFEFFLFSGIPLDYFLQVSSKLRGLFSSFESGLSSFVFGTFLATSLHLL